MFLKLFAAMALVRAVSAIPTRNNTCTPETVKTRVEWANMKTADKLDYTRAVNCLMKLPAQTGINGVVTRFDDMNAMHQVQSNDIHRDKRMCFTN
jgi:tyrosinase